MVIGIRHLVQRKDKTVFWIQTNHFTINDNFGFVNFIIYEIDKVIITGRDFISTNVKYSYLIIFFMYLNMKSIKKFALNK